MCSQDIRQESIRRWEKGGKRGEKKRKEIKYISVVQFLPRQGSRFKLPALQIEPHPWHSPVFSHYDTSYISNAQ